MVEAVRAASAALVGVGDAASDAAAILTDRAILVPVVVRLVHALSDDSSTEILNRMVEKRQGYVDF